MIRWRAFLAWALVLLSCAVLDGCWGGGAAPIQITFPSGAAQMVDQGQSLNFMVTLKNDTTMQGVTWSLKSLGTLSNITKTSVTYNAPAVVNAAGVDHLIATSVQDPTKSASIAITLEPPPGITIASLPDGINATAYSQQVQASGGVGTLSFTVSAGTLPAGLTMSASGLITGKPTGSNVTSNFTITVSDQGTPPLTNMKALSIHIAPPPALTITSTSPLPNGTTNVAYNSSGAVSATGGIAPVTFAITGGTLPHGLSLNTSTGLITGTPDTTANNFGVFNFTVQVSDSAIPPQTPSKAFSMTINPPMLAITNTTLPNGQVGLNYSGTVQAMGGFPPLAFSVSGGTLPNGLALNAANGAITSMPTVANTFMFTIKVQDAAAQMVTQAYTVTIAPPISVALTTPPPAMLQAALTAQVAATVSNDSGSLGVDWSVTCGSASCGSFNPSHTASGANTTYTAPAAVPTGGTVTITAASTADPTKKASGMTTITPPPIIVTFVMTQPPTSLQVSTSATVTAHVANDATNAGVDWSVTCGSPSCGSFSATHTASDTGTMFTAPAAVPTGSTVIIKAASTADGTKFVTATITITTAPPIAVTFVMAPPTSLQVDNSVMVSAHVANDGTNAGVDWSVTCGSAGACGSFTAAHTASDTATTFMAPAAVPTGNTVTIKAASTADNSKFVTAVITITTAPPIMIVFTNALPTSVATSSMTAMSVTLTNDSMTKGADWTVTCGSAGACGSFTSAHTASGVNTSYSAPSAVPTGNTVTIKATSTADGTKFVTAVVTITAVVMNNSKLNGDYAFLFNGFDGGVPGRPVAIAGRFHADGNGGISGFTGDVNRSSGVSTLAPGAGDGYSIGSDNRGTITLGGIKFSIVINAAGNARIIEFDDSTGTGTRGSGVVKKQDLTAANLTSFSGDFAFGSYGELPNAALTDGFRFAMLGRFTAASGTGLMSKSTVDVSVPNFSFNSPLTGQLNAITATSGRGTAQAKITTIPSPPSPFSSLTMNFALYVVSATEAYWVETDVRGSTQTMVSGTVLKQSSSSFTLAAMQGSSVLYSIGVVSGASNPSASVSVGEVTLDGTGTVTLGVFDQNEGGTINSMVPIGGTLVLDSTFNGRSIFNFCPGAGCNPSNAKPQVLYIVGQNKGFLLEGTAASPGDEVTIGFLEQQSAGPFTEASIAGVYASGTITPAVSADTSECGEVTVTSGAPSSFMGTEDFSNAISPELQPGLTLAGTYMLNNVLGSSGRFTATTTQPSQINGAPFVVYAISQTKFLIISVVPNDKTSQISVFEQ